MGVRERDSRGLRAWLAGLALAGFLISAYLTWTHVNGAVPVCVGGSGPYGAAATRALGREGANVALTLASSSAPRSRRGSLARSRASCAAREEAIRPVNTEAASRMFVGPLLTYVLMDGLFVGDGPPRPPAPERIEELVDLFVGAIT